MQRDESTVEGDECRWRTVQKADLTSHHRVVRDVRTTSDTFTPPLKKNT